MNTWLKEKKNDVSIKYLLFFLSPFVSFAYSLIRTNTKSSYIIFFLVSILFGLTFTITNQFDNALDGAYYRWKFENYSHVSSSEYFNDLIGFLEFDEGKKDFYFETLSFFLTKLTDNYHVMFMVGAAIFSIFALKSLRYFTSNHSFDKNIVSFILLYLFTYNQIFNINGIRFWTAAWIAIFCFFKIFRDNNKKYILLLLLTPFFHGSYWLLIAVVTIAIFFKKFNQFWIFLFFISFFISSFAIELAQGLESYLPTFISRMVNTYTSHEIITRKQEWSGYGFLPLIFSFLVKIYINIMSWLIILNKKNFLKDDKTSNVYLFFVVWITIFNFLIFIPSVGNRFIQLSYPLIAYLWLVGFKDKKYKGFIILLPVIFSFNILDQIIKYTKIINLDIFIMNPFLIIYKYIG